MRNSNINTNVFLVSNWLISEQRYAILLIYIEKMIIDLNNCYQHCISLLAQRVKIDSLLTNKCIRNPIDSN